MATIFPDVEPQLITLISDALNALDLTDVVVSVKKPDPQTSPYPDSIITVRSDGGNMLERDIVRTERVGVNVWANTYYDASSLANIVEAVLRDSRTESIKLIETMLSPVRVANDGPQEQRYMTFQLVVKATDV